MNLTIQEIQQIETEMLKEVHEICERNNILYYLAYGSVLGAVRHGGPIPWDTDLDIIVPIDNFKKFIKYITIHLSKKYYFEYYETDKFSTPLFGRIGLKGYSTRILHIDVFKLIGIPDDTHKQFKIQKKLELLQKKHYIKRVQKWDLINFSTKGKIAVSFNKILTLFVSSKRVENKHEFLCQKYPYKDSFKVANASGGYGKKEITDKELYGNGILVKYDGFSVRVPEKYDEYLTHFYGNYMKLPSESERRILDYYTIYKFNNK